MTSREAITEFEQTIYKELDKKQGVHLTQASVRKLIASVANELTEKLTQQTANSTPTVKWGDTVYLVECTINLKLKKKEFFVSSYEVSAVQYTPEKVSVNISRDWFDYEDNWFTLGVDVFKDESDAIVLRDRLRQEYENRV